VSKNFKVQVVVYTGDKCRGDLRDTKVRVFENFREYIQQVDIDQLNEAIAVLRDAVRRVIETRKGELQLMAQSERQSADAVNLQNLLQRLDLDGFLRLLSLVSEYRRNGRQVREDWSRQFPEGAGVTVSVLSSALNLLELYGIYSVHDLVLLPSFSRTMLSSISLEVLREKLGLGKLQSIALLMYAYSNSIANYYQDGNRNVRYCSLSSLWYYMRRISDRDLAERLRNMEVSTLQESHGYVVIRGNYGGNVMLRVRVGGRGGTELDLVVGYDDIWTSVVNFKDIETTGGKFKPEVDLEYAVKYIGDKVVGELEEKWGNDAGRRFEAIHRYLMGEAEQEALSEMSEVMRLIRSMSMDRLYEGRPGDVSWDCFRRVVEWITEKMGSGNDMEGGKALVETFAGMPTYVVTAETLDTDLIWELQDSIEKHENVDFRGDIICRLEDGFIKSLLEKITTQVLKGVARDKIHTPAEIREFRFGGMPSKSRYCGYFAVTGKWYTVGGVRFLVLWVRVRPGVYRATVLFYVDSDATGCPDWLRGHVRGFNICYIHPIASENVDTNTEYAFPLAVFSPEEQGRIFIDNTQMLYLSYFTSSQLLREFIEMMSISLWGVLH